MKRFLVLILLALAVCFLGSAFAQKARLEGTISERVSTEVQTSGALLVGLTLGSWSNTVDPTELSVYVPNSASKSTICIRAITRNGAYVAQGDLRTAEGIEAFESLRTYSRWEGREVVAKLEHEDFAVRARSGDGCSSNPSAPLVPVVLPIRSDLVTIYLNTNRAISVSAQIVLDGQPREMKCSAPKRKVSVAFDTKCSIDMSMEQAETQASLVVTRQPRAGPKREDVFLVILPADSKS